LTRIAERPLLLMAFLTATACSIHVVENLVMRLLPVPFLRLGLSNVVVLYLILQHKPMSALLINVTKAVVGGAVTFTLLSPSTLLSLGGGTAAVLAMYLAFKSGFGFSEFGISVTGAIAHNLAQLYLVQKLILPQARVFMLTPLLILLGLISGMIIAWLMLLVQSKYDRSRLTQNEANQ